MKKIIAITGFFGLLASLYGTSFAGYFNPAPVVRCDTQITYTLQRGSESNEVYILQNFLINNGFLSTRPNGYFGSQTQYAVKLFQTNNGISRTGSVGPRTRDAINELLCDNGVVNNGVSYDGYGYGNGVTYVTNEDPYVRVISPQANPPAVYQTGYTGTIDPVSSYVASPISSPVYNNLFSSPVGSPVNNNTVVIPPATTISSVQGSGIVYNPASGYSYGITPLSGSVTVTSPVANATYQEGDTVFVNWSTNNLSVTAFSILLESEISRQSAPITTVSGNSASFVLTKELLDSVCSGTCNNSQQGSFKIIVSTPSVDIAGNVSNLRAAVFPITIKRPLGTGKVNISASKTPVDSGEVFKLFVNIPTDTLTNNLSNGSYSIRVSALCPASVTASVAGNVCGQEFAMPFTTSGTVAQQQEIPAAINNPTWFKQDVTFRVNVVDIFGRVIGTAVTMVTANGAVIRW